MKIGDTVVCVSDRVIAGYLTEGKHYKIMDIKDTFLGVTVLITSDKGKNEWFFLDRFSPLPTYNSPLEKEIYELSQIGYRRRKASG